MEHPFFFGELQCLFGTSPYITGALSSPRLVCGLRDRA